MKNKLKKITLIFILLLSCTYAYFLYNTQNTDKLSQNLIVELNEIEQLSKLSRTDSKYDINLDKAITSMQNELRTYSFNSSFSKQLTCFYIISLLFISLIVLYSHFNIIKPFNKLEAFAKDISKGNFDSPLYVEKQNLFGDFTWAFDMMRQEIKTARNNEKEAINNNKTVIATLSHDIKTPVASIRAYTEALKLNMDTTAERKARYLSVIMKKCDEVSALTDDLFIHSLSDLEKLEVSCSNYQSNIIITDILTSVAEANQMYIIYRNELPTCTINVDLRRLEQIFENIISNSVKYSSSKKLNISFDKDKDYLICILQDYGKGIPDEDLPFIFDKFYRGHNIDKNPGAGLGLFIVKFLIEQMNGYVDIHNNDSGLVVTLRLKLS